MATAKGDEDSEQRPHPLAQDRPGVYVHMVGSPRRRGAARAESGEIAVEASRNEPITVPGETVESEIVRQSGVSFEGAGLAADPPSENTNDRPELMAVSLPAPARVPNMTLSGQPLPEAPSASLLDAPHSLRPDTRPSPRSGPSWPMLGLVGTLSAIIAAAAVVALRQPVAKQPVEAQLVQPPPADEQVEQPSGFARYAADHAARQEAAQEAAAQAAKNASTISAAAPAPNAVPQTTATTRVRTAKPAAVAPAVAQPAAVAPADAPSSPAEPASQPAVANADPAAPAPEPAPADSDSDGPLPPNPYEQ